MAKSLRRYRTLLVPHPYDELWYRALVGQVATTVDMRLGPEVLSYRLQTLGPGWQCLDYRYGMSHKRDEIRSFVAGSDFGALGLMDVKDYYPGVKSDTLADELNGLGCRDGDVEAVCRWLGAWQEYWAVLGIPVGPEASGILGNAALASIDRRLRAEGFRFRRYTDDYTFFLQDAASWDGVFMLMKDQLSRLGLTLNPEKVKCVLTRKRALKEGLNLDIERIKLLAARGDERAPSECLSLLAREAEAPHPNSNALRYCLGFLGRDGRPEGLFHLRKRIELLQLAPRKWGQYLTTLRERGLIDAEELVDLGLRDESPKTALGRSHVLLAARGARMGRSDGMRLEGLVLQSQPSAPIPIRCVAVELWSRSDRWKPSRAEELVWNLGDSHLRRALVLTLKSAEGKKQRRILERLRVGAPHLQVSIDWVANGCPKAA